MTTRLNVVLGKEVEGTHHRSCCLIVFEDGKIPRRTVHQKTYLKCKAILEVCLGCRSKVLIGPITW